MAATSDTVNDRGVDDENEPKKLALGMLSILIPE